MGQMVGSRVAAMLAAYQRTTGLEPTVQEVERLLVDQEWTPEVLDAIDVCARHALAHSTALARLVGAFDTVNDPEATAGRIAARLVRELGNWRREPQHLRTMLAWLPVIAAETEMVRLYGLLAPGSQDHPEYPTLRREWIRWVGYERGPLAFAAGVPLAEARRATSAGTLRADSLRLLAGLRGAILPVL